MGRKKIYFGIKRLIDVILSFLAIIILFIPGIIIAICIKIESKGPVFFKQKRVKNVNNIYDLDSSIIFCIFFYQ